MKIFLISLLFSPSLVFGFELIARGHHGGRGFNLPYGAIISNATPKINEQGEVTFKIIGHSLNQAQSIFLSDKLVYTGEDGLSLSEPVFSEKGGVLFSESLEGLSKGIFKYDKSTQQTSLILDAKKYPHIESFSQIYESKKGELAYRATTKDAAREFYIGDDKVLSETPSVLTPNYLFSPRIRTNDLGEIEIFARVRLGLPFDFGEGRPDKLLMVSKKENRVLLEDYDSNQNSPYQKIETGFALSKSTGDIAIYATDLSTSLLGKKSLIFVSANAETKTLITEGERGILAFDNFWPVMNGKGQIAFRAFTDLKGAKRRGIFVYDIHSDILRLIVAEDDEIPSDIFKSHNKLNGGTYVYFNKYDNARDPGFSGGLDINERGELVFHVVLADSTMKYYLGNAIYLYKL